MNKLSKIFLAFLFIPFICNAQGKRTVGLQLHKKGTLEDGYVLFAPMTSSTTYMVDRCGKQIQTWQSKYTPALSAYFMPDGSLLRTGNDIDNLHFTTGGHGGYIEKLDWDSKVLWSCKISDSMQCLHHDICPLPNGNILAIVYELKTDAECSKAGRMKKYLTKGLWSEKIIEIAPKATNDYDVVWEWHVWDHLVQNADSTMNNYAEVYMHPELINVNCIGINTLNADWLHINAVAYNPGLDQIMLSNHNFSEIWIIDHSTTTVEAASHKGGKTGMGGDLLYRWGNPQCYDNGTAADQKLFQQHNAHWIEDQYPNAGKIILFNNGLGRPDGAYSSVEIITPPLNVRNGTYTTIYPPLPEKQDRIYKDSTPTSLYSAYISGAQALKNGNILLCNGEHGFFEEVDNTDHKLWAYINPVLTTPVKQGDAGGAPVFRCTYYPETYAGFSKYTPLTAGQPIELNSPQYDCYIPALPASIENAAAIQNGLKVNNPFNNQIIIYSGTDIHDVAIALYDVLGNKVQVWTGLQFENGNSLSLHVSQELKNGIYFMTMVSKGSNTSLKLIKE